jgi:hypothetical protein
MYNMLLGLKSQKSGASWIAGGFLIFGLGYIICPGKRHNP